MTMGMVPVETDGLGPQPAMFVYLTGRGEHSHLFPRIPVSDVVDEAAKTIPMGYTQLWVIGWLTAVGPSSRGRRTHRRPAASLSHERVVGGASHLVLSEAGHYLGWSDTRGGAVRAARAIAHEQRVRLAVGLLVADVGWH